MPQGMEVRVLSAVQIMVEITEPGIILEAKPQPVIPRYTEWDGLNEAIFRIANGMDDEHPVYGNGKNMFFHGDPFEFKKKGEKRIGVRIVFRSGNSKDRELSYLLNQRPDGSVIIRNEGWVRQANRNDYAPPVVKSVVKS